MSLRKICLSEERGFRTYIKGEGPEHEVKVYV